MFVQKSSYGHLRSSFETPTEKLREEAENF